MTPLAEMLTLIAKAQEAQECEINTSSSIIYKSTRPSNLLSYIQYMAC
jgi:hypothetical protein